MGMYSNFYIRVVDSKGNVAFYLLEEISEALTKITQGYDFYAEKDMIRSGNEIKWYGYEDDILKLSKKYPELTFEVFREYEEGDWLNNDGTLETSHQFRIFKNGNVEEKKLRLMWS